MRRLERTLWILTALAMGLAGCSLPPPTDARVMAREPNALFWGDMHVHTSLSASARGAGDDAVDLDTAYRFARGLPVVHPTTKARVRLERPLDFIIVADHAGALDRESWTRAIETAERHYRPCSFTTFIGWEWPGEVEGRDVHRVVFMDRGMPAALALDPFGVGAGPEALWDWLAETSVRVGADFIAMPRGPNVSRGKMYPKVEGDGNAISAAYARTRMRWEPIAEVTQVEGDSETHPALSPEDALADFERFAPAREGKASGVDEGSYARSALLRGLRIGHFVGVNPFAFGMVGSTGSHNGLASAEEARFWGVSAGPDYGRFSAQGRTAVWADENTRTSLFEAFRRKEVYATTGPRIRVRFFGGWDFVDKQASAANMVTLGYTYGYPMGSELTKGPEGRAPSFLLYAVKDPDGANLDRIQIVKGWVDADGTPQEKVFDVVWSADRQRDEDGEVPLAPSTVDLRTGRSPDLEGAAALHAFWSDHEFDPSVPAFYYMRVLQVPTPRHTLYDAIAADSDPREGEYPPTIRERAYTAPIWYIP